MSDIEYKDPLEALLNPDLTLEARARARSRLRKQRRRSLIIMAAGGAGGALAAAFVVALWGLDRAVGLLAGFLVGAAIAALAGGAGRDG